MQNMQNAVIVATAAVAVGGIYALGGVGAAIPHVLALAVATGAGAAIAMGRQSIRETAFVKRAFERLIVSAMPNDLVIAELQARIGTLASERGWHAVSAWEGELLDEPAWVWSFHTDEDLPPVAMLILQQEDLARLVFLDPQHLATEARRTLFAPATTSLEAGWDGLSNEVSLAAAWAYRTQAMPPLGVAKYASIQSRELGAAPKTADGIDTTREIVFNERELEAMLKLPRAQRTMQMVQRFAVPAPAQQQQREVRIA